MVVAVVMMMVVMKGEEEEVVVGFVSRVVVLSNDSQCVSWVKQTNGAE